MNPVRVLFCEGNIDGTVGGSYYSLFYLVEGLDRARFDPLVVFHRENALQPRFSRAGIRMRIVGGARPFRFARRDAGLCHRFPWLCGPLGLLQSVANLIRFWLLTLRLVWLLKRERIQLVHLNNSLMSNHHWMFAARLAGIPCITHERGINRYFTPMARRLAPTLDAIICISGAVRDSLISQKVADANLHLIHNGLDPSRVAPGRTREEVRRALNLPEGPVIGLIGNIRSWKGQDVLIRALPAIVRRHPGLRCLFVGESSPSEREYQEGLHALIDSLGVGEHVIFTGHTSNVADFLSVMDVAVHASVEPEPFGRVLLEAMAMRRPIVGSRDGAVTEIVVNGETGLTYTPGNSEELAARILDLLDDPPRASALGEAGYRRLVSEFPLRLNVERTMALYDRVLAARSPRNRPKTA